MELKVVLVEHSKPVVEHFKLVAETLVMDIIRHHPMVETEVVGEEALVV